MTTFKSKWLQAEIRTAETDIGASVSSVSAPRIHTTDKVSRAPAQSMAFKCGDGGGEEKSTQTLENGTDRTDRTPTNDDDSLRTGHPTPSQCRNPLVCPTLGICGREACLADSEWGPFATAMVAARSASNPHRAPDFYDISIPAYAAEETADAA